MSENTWIAGGLLNAPKTGLKQVGTILLTFSLLVVINESNGQRIDSLKTALYGKTGNSRCDLLYQLAFEYIDLDNQLGLSYASEALRSARNLGDSLRIVKAGRIESLAFRRLGQLDSSLALSLEVLAIAERHNYVNEVKIQLNALALVYTHKAYYDKALKCYLQSLEMSEKEGDYDLWITLNNIGLVYYKLEDYDKALAYYEQALTRKMRKDAQDAITLINMSLCYAYKNNFLSAQDLVDQALTLCDKACSKNLQMYANFSSGFIAFGLNKLAAAEIEFRKSYRVSLELDDERFQLDNIVYLSKVYLKAGRIDAARDLLEEAEDLISAGVSYNLGLIQVYSELADLHKKRRDFERVALYQSKYIQLKDSIYGEELTRNLMRVESEYLERENKAKIEAQTQILSLNEEVIFRQQVVNAFTAISALLLTILTIKQIRSNRQKRAANIFLEQKVKERTIELEQSNDTLVRSLEERNVLLQKVSSNITSSVATIKGLCSLGLSDSETSYGGHYIRKIEATSDQLLSIVNRTLLPKTTK